MPERKVAMGVAMGVERSVERRATVNPTRSLPCAPLPTASLALLPPQSFACTAANDGMARRDSTAAGEREVDI